MNRAMEGAAPSYRDGRVSPKRRPPLSGGVPGWVVLVLAAIGIYAWQKYEANKTSTATATSGVDTVSVAAATDAAADVVVINHGTSSASDRARARAESSRRAGFAGRLSAFAALLGLVALLSVPAATARHSSQAAAVPSTLWAVDVT